jgi:hypothetical protein
MKDIDALLRRYDAAPNTPPTPADSARADELLTRIGNTPRTDTVVRMPARRRLLVLSLAGVAAASVAGAVVAAQSSSHSASHASTASAPLSVKTITKAELDSWMAAPAAPSAADKAASACLKGAKGAADPQIDAVDQRGGVLTLLAKDPVSQQVWWCLDTPAGTYQGDFVTGPGWPVPAKPAAAGAVNMLASREESQTNTGSLGYAYGQAGPGVTSVTYITQAGRKFTASVQNGYWNVWWPETASLPDDLDKATVTWTAADGTGHTAGSDSITQNLPYTGNPLQPTTLLPPSGPGKPYVHLKPVNPNAQPNQEATTIAKACLPNTTATISNVVQVGRSFELACTYPGSGDQWVVTYNSAQPANALIQDNAYPVNPGGPNGRLPLPAIAKNAVNVLGGEVGGPTTSSYLGAQFGRVGADVTSVTLVTDAGQKITAKVQNGLWTALWPSKPSKSNYDFIKTATWTTSNGTTYTVSGNKFTNGLKVPASAVVTGPTAK